MLFECLMELLVITSS